MKKSELRALIREQVKSLLKEANANSFELAYPDTYTAKWSISDATGDENTVAKKFDFSILIEHPGSELVGTTIKDSFTLAFSKDSRGIYSLGKDVEKFMGVPEADAIKNVEDGKEKKDDSLIYGMCNIMNGGKDIYFWNNGSRIGGASEYAGVLVAVIEQLSHEAGVHLNRLVLTRHIAREKGVNIDNGDWVTNDYGDGKYSWPAIGDPTDKSPKIIAIDEETFATVGGAIVSIVTPTFIEMASKYIPQLNTIKSI
jgi:hypothetical protein